MQIPDFTQDHGQTLRSPALHCSSEAKVIARAGDLVEYRLTVSNEIGKDEALPALPRYLQFARKEILAARAAADDAHSQPWESNALRVPRQLGIDVVLGVYRLLDAQPDMFEEAHDGLIPVLTELSAVVHSVSMRVVKGRFIVAHTLSVICATSILSILGCDILLQFRQRDTTSPQADNLPADSTEDELPAEL